MMRSKFGLKGIVLIILGVPLIFFGSFCLSGWVIMLLWNWLMVDLFGLSVITFWKGVGISIALTIIGGIFKSVSKS